MMCSFAAENHRCQLALVHSACHQNRLMTSLADSLLSMRTDVVTSSCQHGGRDRDPDYVINDDDSDGKTVKLVVSA